MASATIPPASAEVSGSLRRACSAATAQGTLWPVDAALRPEGKQGPLVRTVSSHAEYYKRWAKTWEFQALLKARPVAGDIALGDEYVAMVSPMVWSAAERDGFVEDVQAMRRRVVAHIPAKEAEVAAAPEADKVAILREAVDWLADHPPKNAADALYYRDRLDVIRGRHGAT